MRFQDFGVAMAAVVIIAATPAAAQSDREPSWATAPDGELTGQLMPRFANMLGISGSALIECRVVTDGHPFNCRVVSESHHGLGFGAAARLVVASGEINTARVAGAPIGSTFRARVNFVAADLEDRTSSALKGPVPTPRALALAREIISQANSEIDEDSDRMDGLDYDRRAVVSGWMDELMPITASQKLEIRAQQFSRLFSETDLKRILNGERVEMPSAEDLLAACPEPTPAEMEALRELKRRYCGQYEC